VPYAVAPVAPPAVATNDLDLKTMMIEMLKHNQEFQNKVIEMMCSQQTIAVNAAVNAAAAASTAATAATAAASAASTATAANYTNSNNYNGTTNSHNNNNNNTFNLQLFLNDQCKDAMNINEFASTIHLKVTDLDEFGRVGYVAGMSKLFIDTLKETDVFKRPIHCSDARRETLYVKHADKWEREGPENTKITNAVRVVEHKNIVLVNEWAKQNPRCEDSTTTENTQYINMSRAVLDGDDRNIAKVIKKVAKEVVIEKGAP
jgi:nucleoside diphosphate kinase